MTTNRIDNGMSLEAWLRRATCHLSAASCTQVRTEIQEHYESAREAAMSGGATAEQADRVAVASLGEAKAANRQYRKVLLTASEARLLGNVKWEARAVCSRPYLKVLLQAIPTVALFSASLAFTFGESGAARMLLAGGIMTGLLFAASFLPIRTPLQGRVFRCVKWIGMVAAMWLAFWPAVLQWSWLVAASLWPLAWAEWTQISLRRKLPVAEWPRQLYF